MSRSAISLRMRIGLMCVATVLALVVGEVLIRGLNAAPELKSLDVSSENCVYRRSDNPLLGFELKPDYRCANPDYIATYERTNACGLRDDDRSIDRAKGVKRILLLGDSVVEGYGLEHNATISKQLEKLSLGLDWEVLNFGVSAYCTRAEIELLETKGLPFRPEVVVLVFVENDFDDFNREAFPLGDSIERPAIAEWCFKKSHLFRLASLELNLFRFRQTDPVAWNSEAIGDNNVAVGLKRFRELADTHRFQPLIAIWPRFEDDQIVDMHRVPGSEQLIVEALAALHKIPTFRLSACFQANFEVSQSRSPRLTYSQGDKLHPSAEGARIAAVGIYETLNGELPLAQPSSVGDDEIQAAVKQLPREEPNYARVYNRVGNRLLQSGDPMGAIEQYELALQEDVSIAATYNNLGIAVQRLGEPESLDTALHYYRRAIEIQPDFSAAHLNLGHALEASDRTAAQEHFIRAVQIHPQFVSAHFSLSRSLYRAGRLAAAEAGLGQVLKLDPDHIGALLLLATLQTKQQRLTEAKSTFERLLQVQPDHAEALNNLAALCLTLGDEQAAISHLRAAVAADPNHPRAAKNLKNLLEDSHRE